MRNRFAFVPSRRVRLTAMVAVALLTALVFAQAASAGGSGRSIYSIAGQQFSGIVADYSCDCSPDTATIDWGDGSSSSGTFPAGSSSGSITGTHTYSAAGTYTTTIHLVGHNTTFDATFTGTANVTPASSPPPQGIQPAPPGPPPFHADLSLIHI